MNVRPPLPAMGRTCGDPAANQRAVGLVNRIAAGDEDAESMLIKLYRHRLLRSLAHQTSKNDVEDIAHDALISLIVRLRAGPIDQPANLWAYLRGIASNMARASARKKNRRKTESDTVFVEQQVSKTVPIESQMYRDQQNQKLRDVIARLKTDRDRYVLYNFYLADQDKQAICAALNLESQHFHRVLHRARRRLGDIITRSSTEEPENVWRAAAHYVEQ